jgi:serine/threonine protein kinase
MGFHGAVLDRGFAGIVCELCPVTDLTSAALAFLKGIDGGSGGGGSGSAAPMPPWLEQPTAGSRVSWRVVGSLLLALLSALDHMHSRGYLHMDLHPGNVLVSRLDDPGSLKLVDFGSSQAATGWVKPVPATPNLPWCLRRRRCAPS